jgi:hypothetical protein
MHSEGASGMNETKRQNAFELICKPASNKRIRCRDSGCTTCRAWASNHEFSLAFFQIAKGKHPEDSDWIDPWNSPRDSEIESNESKVYGIDRDLARQQYEEHPLCYRICADLKDNIEFIDLDITLDYYYARYYMDYFGSGSQFGRFPPWSVDMVLALYDVFLDASPNKILSGSGVFTKEMADPSWAEVPWPMYCLEMAIVHMRWTVSKSRELKDIYNPNPYNARPPDIQVNFDDREKLKNWMKNKDVFRFIKRWSGLSEEERKIRRKVVDSSPHGRDDAWSLLVSGWYSAHFILEKELEINSAWCDEFNFSNEIINASSYNPNRILQLMSESGASSVPMNLHDMQDIFRIRTASAH